MTLLSSCRYAARSDAAANPATICLKAPILGSQSFYATGSASTLEQAKLNARQDLVQQISSDVSSHIENTKTDDNGSFRQQSVSRARSESVSIPVDQHKISQTCQSGDSYFVAITLQHAALVEVSRLRLQQELKAAKSILRSLKKASLFRQYNSHKTLSEKYRRIITYRQILQQYDKTSVDSKTLEAIVALEQFVLESGKLIVGIDKRHEQSPLHKMLEIALNKAGFDYIQGRKNTVATITIKTKQSQHKNGNRHIVKLNASLDVNRSDTQKLLSRYELGQVITSSTVSVSLARENAERKLAARLKQHLNTSAHNIRKILGFESDEK